MKPFPEKFRQSIQNHPNQNLGIRTLLENGFGAALRSKTNVLSVLTKHFPDFPKFLSDKSETIF